MREKLVFLSIALTLMISIVLFGPTTAHAYTLTNPTVYVDTTLNRTVPLQTFIEIPFKTAVGQTQTLYIKVARAPHETHEPPLGTDKTLGYQFRLSWDPDMFYLRHYTDVQEEPPTVSTTANFLKRRMYIYNPDLLAWELSGIYSPNLAKANHTGTVIVGNTLTAPSPTTVPLPAEYFDPIIGPTAPDAGRHSGANYDLPYTENATQPAPQLDGLTTITDPQYVLLGVITLTAKAVPPPGYTGSSFHLSDVVLINYGAGQYLPVETFDAVYGFLPVTPEFPLGLDFIILLTTAILVVYIWRHKPRPKQPSFLRE